MNHTAEQRVSGLTAARERINICYHCDVDIAGDLISGLLLTQLLYYSGMEERKQKSKLRVQQDGHYWIAKSRDDWYDEIRITPRQVDRAVQMLVSRDLIYKEIFKFNGVPMMHLRVNFEQYEAELNRWRDAQSEEPENVEPNNQRENSILHKGENGNQQKCKMDIDESVIWKSTKGENGNQQKGDILYNRDYNRDYGRDYDRDYNRESSFEEFWKAYPRKVGKRACESIWLKMKPSREVADKMLKALEWQKESKDWKKNGGQFIPHPSTWLNQGRWDDEPTDLNEDQKRQREASDEWYRQSDGILEQFARANERSKHEPNT